MAARKQQAFHLLVPLGLGCLLGLLPLLGQFPLTLLQFLLALARQLLLLLPLPSGGGLGAADGRSVTTPEQRSICTTDGLVLARG